MIISSTKSMPDSGILHRGESAAHMLRAFAAVSFVLSALILIITPNARAEAVYASVPDKQAGYGHSPYEGPFDFMMFTEYPVDISGTDVEDEAAEQNPEDLSSSELLHAYDAPVEDSTEAEALVEDDTAAGLSGSLETDILSPLTVYSEQSKPHVDRNIKLFSETLKDRFGMWLSRSGRYVDMMKEVFREQGMPEDLVYIALIESGFNPKAYSWAKASGPWQFIKGTGKKYGLRIDSWVDERRDPVKSTKAAAAYLKDLYNMFGTWSLSMAAYNAGEGRVSRAVNKVGTLDFWKIRDARAIVRETREYVPRYIAAKAIAKDPAAFGFGPIEYEPPFEFDMVELDAPLALDAAAKCCDTTVDEIKSLNPELRRWCTPPDRPGYQLRVPKGRKDVFIAKYKELPESDKSVWSEYVVRRGDTLGRIAGRYNVSVSEIARMNNIRRASMISIGQRLVIPAPGGVTTAVYHDYDDDESYATSTYKVRRGDTLSSIARRHRMSTTRLARLNGISTRSIIRPGQRLKVSGTVTASVGSSSSGASYRVRRGDTIWDISRKFGVSMNSLMKANSLGRRSVLKPGQKLVIPSKKGMDT